MAAANVVNTLIVPAASRVAPYYDDFDESKNFHRVMFRPGYAVQARELTQLQTILQNQVERFGRHIFVNGSSVIGGKMDVSDVITLNVYPEYANAAVDINSFKNKTIRYRSGNTTNNYVSARVIEVSEGSNTAPPAIHVKYVTGTEFGPGATIRTTDNTVTANLAPTSNVSSNGSIAFIYDSIYFMQGHFVKVPAHSVVVSKHNRTANVKVGLELIDNIITEADDISLLDPALEASNYQAPGAGRYQLILSLATRDLNSIDDAKWIQIAKIENGVVRELITTPIYSEIEDVLARRTYDESGNYVTSPFRLKVEESTEDPSNNFTLVVSPGKAYLYGYEVENQAETRIEIPRARTRNFVNNYDLNCNYGNYVIVDNLKGAFPLSTMGVVDMHCVAANLINYATSGTYNSSKIGTARVRDINFYSGETDVNARKHEFYFFDTKFRTITGNATSSVGNNQSIVMNSIDVSGANDAYVGAFIKIVAGNSAGDVRIITGYDGNAKTATVYPVFSYNIDTSSQYELQFDITDVDSFVTDSRYSGTGATTNASATISIQSKDDNLLTGNTFAYDQKMSSSLFLLPSSYIAPGLTDQSYVYRKVFSSVPFTSGNSSVLTAASDENFVGGSSTSNVTSTVMDNFLVVVTANTGSARQLGEQIKVSTSVTTSLPEQATLFTGNTSDSFVASVYAKMTIKDASAQPRVKTLVLANTQTFTSDTADANFLGTTGSNTYVYLNSGQVAIKNPSVSEEESLYISDVITFVKIYNKQQGDPTPGEDLTQLVDVTDRYSIERGHKPEFYDHASIRLRPGFAPPRGWIIVCCRYYKSTNDVGYFSVDSYPYIANTVYEEGKNIGTGYSLIPVLNGLRLADTIDFRPVRPNASNSEYFSFTTARVPVSTTNFTCDYYHYLERRDIIALSTNETIALYKGIPSTKPFFPNQPNKSLLLHRLRVLPYTIRTNDIIIENIDHRRYTMEDISIIDRRVKNLEYNVTLNALEKSAADLTIKDVDGLDRTKYGILADNFTSHLLGDSYASDYLCAIDVDGSFSPTKGILMPGSVTYYDKLEANSATMVNVSRHEDKVLLAYKTAPAISQKVATKAIPLNSYLFAEFRGQIITIPENDRWKDMINLPPDVITIPKIDPRPVTPTPVTPVTPTPTPVTPVVWPPVTPVTPVAPTPTPPTYTAQRLMLDGGRGLTWNAATQTFVPIANDYNKSAGDLYSSVGMSDAMYQKIITDEIRNSGLPGGGSMTPSMTVLDWVDQGYQTLLDRPGEASGIAYWTYMATKNGWDQTATIRAMSQGMIDSGEALGVATNVTGARVNLVPTKILQDNGQPAISTQGANVVLGNNVEINGPNSMGHTTYMPPTGTTTNQNGTTTVSSGGQVNSAALDAQTWVENLYGGLLGRSSDAGGLQYWTSQLTSGALSPQQVRDGFINSTEYKTLHPNG